MKVLKILKKPSDVVVLTSSPKYSTIFLNDSLISDLSAINSSKTGSVSFKNSYLLHIIYKHYVNLIIKIIYNFKIIINFFFFFILK